MEKTLDITNSRSLSAFREFPTVLLVDDDDDQLDLFGSLFKSNGFNVVQTTNAKNALSILDDVYVDLVVCDCIMPDMDGREFVENVRKKRSLTKLPVIGFSASPELSKTATESGADAFCSKQDHETLMETLKLVMTTKHETKQQNRLLERIRSLYA